MRAILVSVVLLACMISVCAAVDIQKMTPKEGVDYIDANFDDPKTQDVISLMIEKIHGETVSSVTDELAFLTDVANFDMRQENNLKNMQKLQDILTQKYADNIDATMQLLTQEMVFYRCLPDQQKLAKVITQMEKLSIELQNRNAIVYLTQQVETGEAYLALPGGDRPGAMREKARGYFQTVIDFHIFTSVYESSYGTLKDIYLRTAVDLMSITEGRDLNKLWFSGFTRREIARRFPEKAKHINSDFADPGRIIIEGTVSDWLRARIVDADKDDPMLPHLQAVWDFVQKRNQAKP